MATLLRSVVFVLVISSLLLISSGAAFAAEEAAESVSLGLWALLPPLIAIGLALIFREVISSLLLGLLAGSLLLSPTEPFQALIRIPTNFLLTNLADPDHVAIILFSLMLGGMVGILAKSGGTGGIVALLERFAKGRRGASVMTWALGIAIFFDDYANTLIVGQTMRPYTDRMKISRAKLAYIVDSTAAPIASIALVSTWIGFELGLLKDASAALNMQTDVYMLFLQALPYHFYSILTIFFVFAITFRDRDFGPMHKAELAALAGNDTSRVESPLAEDEQDAGEATPRDAWIAVIPIALIIVGTFAGLYVSGRESAPADARLMEVFGAADSFRVLLAVSFLGVLAAAFMAMTMGHKPLGDVSEGLLDGFRSMLPTMVILLLAWCLGDVCGRVGTADVIVSIASGNMPEWLTPTAVFLISALVAFATGTSWGAMAILIPIAIPLAHHFATGDPGGAHDWHLLYGSIGAVLAGATFGDHCSPISDTTVMSSMASQCNHIAHVRTQMPYAILSGTVAIMVGYLPAGFGVPPWIGLIVGAGVLLMLPRWFKKN